MRRISRPFTIATSILIAFLWATVVYRAATQSLTSGERWSFAGRAVAGVFGLSEFSLRLPDAAGGLLFLAAVFLVCRLAFGDSGWLLLAVASSVLNPFLLDALSMSSGRGAGLGFFMLGAYFVARWVADGRTIPIAAGVAFGLAAAFDPHQLFAVAALDSAFIGGVVLARLRVRDPRGALRFLIRDALPFCFATVASTAAVWWSTGRPVFADRTAERFLDGVKAFTTSALLYKPTFLTVSETIGRFLARLGWVPLALLMGGFCGALAWILLRWWRQKSPDRNERLLLLFSSTAVVVAGLVWLVPRMTHTRYFGVGGLAFAWPVLSIAGLLLARHHSLTVVAQTSIPSRDRQGANALLFLTLCSVSFLLFLFVLQFQLYSYYGWEAESATRTVVDIMEGRQAAHWKDHVLIAAPARLKPSLDVYRRLREINWLGQLAETSLECHADFYYLQQEHYARLDTLGLKPLLRDPVSKTVLAEVGPAALGRLAALREVGFSDIPQCNAGVLAEGSWVDSAQAGGARHFLRDIADHLEPDRWRWTYERPALLYHVPRREGLRFKMDFIIHGVLFRGKTPLELTVRVNGKEIGRERYTSLEGQTFERAVPASLLRSDGVALVETVLDKYYIAPEDGQKLGYLFVRGGFVE